MKKIIKIEKKKPTLPTRKKVAAYCRVSMSTDRLHHSLSAQVSRYSELIQQNPEWEFAGIYADEGISGTRAAKRPEFQRMLTDCESGKIDMILTKSISRFARNTVDLLKTVRHLKELGIEVRFEKERINSLSSDGEIMLTLLASFAQEETRSISKNVRWSVQKRFEQGQPISRPPTYGYDWKNDSLVINPKEAKIVKKIYQNYLDGKSRIEICKELDTAGIPSKNGCQWSDPSIKSILTNITYTGNMLFQKKYTVDPISKKRKKNTGELPQYYAENTHTAIIDMQTFQHAQDEMARRRSLGFRGNKSLNLCCFSGKIKCESCGKSYVKSRKRVQAKHSTYGDYVTYWICGSTKKKGGHCAIGGAISDTALRQECAKVLGLPDFDEQTFLEQVDYISVPSRQVMVFHMKDGRTIEHSWKKISHKSRWTPESRKKMSEHHRTRKTRTLKGHDFTCFIKCANCGMNYRHIRRTYSDGTDGSYWRCPDNSTCGNTTIKDTTMRKLTADVLGLPDFDEAIMDNILDHAVIDHHSVIFYFKNGHTESRTYQNKRKTYPRTEEHRKQMSKIIKKIRGEKH